MARVVSLLAGLTILTGAAAAAPFTLGAAIQAGSAAGSFEVQLGATSGSPAVTGQMIPYWLDPINHDFQLAYDAATGTATLTARWLFINPAASISWTIPGAAGGGSVAREWTIAPGGLNVTAANNTALNTQVRVRTMSITGPGFAGIGPANLVATQNGSGTVTSANAAAITFQTPANTGSWVFDGQIRFLGLGAYTPGGATGADLRFAFDILSTEVPEPATLLLGALGLAALGVLRHFRIARQRRGSDIVKG